MTVSTPQSTTRTLTLRDGLAVTVQEYSGPATSASPAPSVGTGVLLLHGGAGPGSVAGFAAGLAQDARVVVPVHPGFDGTPRPALGDFTGAEVRPQRQPA